MDSQLFTDERLGKLRQAIDQSETIMADFRKQRQEALKEYVGAHYSTQGSPTYNPVNLLWLWVKIHMQSLAARQPRVMCSTPFPEHKPSASNLELALDVLMGRIKLGDTLRLTVMEAIFGIGMVYIGLNQSDTVKVGGQTHAVGQPFCDPIFMDEAIFDLSSRTIEQMQFMGHSYLISREEYEQCGLFEQGESLTVIEKKGTGYHGTDRSESLTTGGKSMSADYKQFYRLRNLWLPLDGPNGVVVTIEDTEDGAGTTGVLREEEWDGPGQGPYRMLRFNEIPGNIMPLAPIANLIDLHRFHNSIFRKLEKQARNTKTLFTYEGSAKDDADRMASHDDMDIVRVDNNSKVQERTISAIDPKLLALNPMIRDQYSWFGGNLDTLGGLSPMSKTVGQDEMLSESASKQVADMQRATTDFTADVVRDLAWWMWTDPLIHIPITKRVRGTEIELQSEFSARTRKGDFLDYNISIDPYSMQHSSPEKKLAAIINTLERVVIPMMPAMEQQGLTIDMRTLVKLAGKYSDAPELYEIVTALDAPIRPDSGPVGEAPSKSPVTTRNYVRHNRTAGPTRPNRDNAMIQAALGSAVQGAEAAGAYS